MLIASRNDVIKTNHIKAKIDNAQQTSVCYVVLELKQSQNPAQSAEEGDVQYTDCISAEG